MSRLSDIAAALEAGSRITPVQEAMARWNGVFTREAIERVNAQRMLDADKDARSGAGRFRGSLLGHCLRQQMISYRGGYFPEEIAAGSDTWWLLQDGTELHYLWQTIGLSAGWLTEIEQRFEYAPWRFVGQSDGTLAHHPHWGKGVLEVKTMVEPLYNRALKEGVFPEHLAQGMGYGVAGGFDFVSYLYMTRSFTPRWKEFVVVVDPNLTKQVQGTVDDLHAWEARGELPPVKAGYPSDRECTNYCSFKKICPVAEF
jgi:hypothetical protein